MGLGRNVLTIEETDARGVVTTRPVPLEAFARDAEIADEPRRDHFRLSADLVAGNPLRIVAGQPITIAPAFAFEKYELVVREAVDILIAFDQDASPEFYDDVLISGWSSRSDRVPPTERISLWFDAAPATPVELIVYAGRAADPT